MKLSRFHLLSSAAILALGICASDGQTSGPAVQNAPRVAPANSGRPNNPRLNNSNLPYVRRGPANIAQRPPGSLPAQMQSQPVQNLRPNYPPPNQQLNPMFASASVQHSPRTYNVQPNGGVTPRGDIAQTVLPVTNAQPAAKTDDPAPAAGLAAKQGISEASEDINTQRVAKNDGLEPTARDLANGQVKRHKGKLNGQTGKNRFSYSDALRRNWHEWHNRDWWKQHCNTVVFVTGGYYFLDASYWYPAWGYDPANSYYDYDGPIYTYGNLLPDQVIANVQSALQEAGYYFGAVTGSLSVDTRAALANFQRDQGLIVTGAIDEPTVAALGLY